MSGAPWKGSDRVANGPVRDAENAKLICGALGVEFDSLYEELPASRALGGVCGCGERMLRPAPRCGFCELEQGLGLPSGGRVAA